MSPNVIDQIWEAGRILLLSGIAAFAFKTARSAAENIGRLKAVRNGLLWCIGIAIFAAASVGSPSCEEPGDPMRGGCVQYADDGYEAPFDQRVARFAFWAIFLIAPVVLGTLDAAKLEKMRNE